jgi:PAS domain S-box-containing protein
MTSSSKQRTESAAANELLRLELDRCRRELNECHARLAAAGRADKLRAGERQLLEMIANGAALALILEALCRLSEELSDGVVVSILLLSSDGRQLRHGAAPSLPQAYTDAIDGGLIGPDAASCGTAAFRRQTVIVSDIATDPLWSNYRDLALIHGLQACWSTPIFSTINAVLGTFAFYTHKPGYPTPEQRSAVEQFAHLASIVIERARAQEALLRSEAYLEEAQRLSQTGSFGWNVTTGELIWSDETFRLLGYDQKVKPVLDLVLKRVHPDDLAFVQNTLEQAAQDEKDVDFEHRLLLPDGQIRHVHVKARPNRARGGELEFVGAVMDITERKNSQEALRSAKSRFEGILEIADDAIISVNSSQRVVLFNQGAEKVFGYEAAEVIGQSLDLLLPERFLKSHRGHIELFARSPEVARSMAQRRAIFGRHKDGREFPAEASISKLVLGDEVIFTVILRDITERLRLENRLRQSEKNLAEGQRLTKTGSWVLDYKTGNTDWSVETCRIFGFPDPPPSPHYSEFRARVRPEDQEAVDRGLRESFETGEPRPLEYLFILPNGVSKHIETISQPVKDETGAVVCLMGTVMDVTERKQAEAAIRASEKWARGQAEALTRVLEGLARESSMDRIVEHVLRTITAQLDAHSSSVWLRDEASDLMSFQFALENNTFNTRANATLTAISPSLNINDVWPWPEVVRTGRPYVLEDIRTGSAFPWRAHILAQGVISILIVPMLIAGKVEGVIGIRFTQPRKFRPEEMELAQSLAHQAMLAMQLSRLSAQSRESAVISERNRMARDIHDTLAQGFTGVIVQLEAAEDASSKGLTQEAHNHVARAGKLARYGLSEARRSVQALRLQGLDDGDLCTAMDDLFRKLTADTGLHLEFSLSGMPHALPPQWEDNLLRIAQEVVTNALRYAHATEFKARLQFEAQSLHLELRDNGCGFDPALKHNGFGLRGMRERTEQMGGEISVQSVVGAGTTILITLPLTENPKPTDS